MTKTKEEVLIANGYTIVNGYCFEYEKDSDMQNIIISREEVIAFYNQEPTKYYFHKDSEYAEDENSAWESLYDSSEDDISFEEWEKKILDME
jgi:hypothetical protein